MRLKKVTLPGCYPTLAGLQRENELSTRRSTYPSGPGVASVCLAEDATANIGESRTRTACRGSMDYMFFTEHGVHVTLDEAEASNREHGGLQRWCLTVMVLKDFKYKSIWAYPVEGKGVGAAEWLISHILEDLDTCGLDGCRLVLMIKNPALWKCSTASPT